MFTLQQIAAAHSMVKSGADFPDYIQAIKTMGVRRYEAYVTDGHIEYHGVNNHTAIMPAKYDPLLIADCSDAERFKSQLRAHQDGRTDFLTFIKMCATVGIEKWEISMDQMTCSYYDKAGNVLLEEKIPNR